MSGLPARPADADDAIATELTAEELARETGADLHRCRRVLPVVLQMVEDYAPFAPLPAKRESALRAGGYILESDYGAIASESVGPREVTYNISHGNFFRRSGAAALLSRYRRRVAATVRED